MARPSPIQSSFRAAFRRLGVFKGDIRETVDAVVPVMPVGADWDQTSRPLWINTGEAGDLAGEFPSCSLNSGLDVEIYQIDYLHTFAGTPTLFVTSMATPPASYIPFDSLTPPGPLLFAAAVRPRLTFDIGNTLNIAGTHVGAPLPFSVALNIPDVGNVPGVPAVDHLVFKSPFILPATMFLTVQGASGNRIRVTFYYRELHTFQGA